MVGQMTLDFRDFGTLTFGRFTMTRERRIQSLLAEKRDPTIFIPVTYTHFLNREITLKGHSLCSVTDFRRYTLYTRETCLALYRVRKGTLHVYNVNW